MLRVAEHVEKSDTGLARRANEDNFFVRSPLFVVADGMGGAQAGEVASRLAAETFATGLPEGGTVEERLATRVLEANSRIYRLSREDSERAGMGTTLTAIYVDGEELAVAHVGDSRAYLWRDGELTRLTRDHSLVDELVRRGKLTEEEAAEHPQRSIITRALGPEPDVEVDTRTYRAQAADVLLLCSDGLTSMISEQHVAELLGAAESLEAAAQALIDAANAAGGRDNITVVLFRLEEAAAGAAAEASATAPLDQPTQTGMRAADARTAVAPAEPETAEQPAARAAAREQPPELPAVVAARRRRAERENQPLPRRVKIFAATVSTLIVLTILGIAGMFATRAVFFVGTNDQGMVTVYKGLPFDLPAGLKLYSEYSVSGVPAAAVPEPRRKELLDHQLRSRSDARDLVAQLELGRLSP
ncbi:Stp1/IreP family PP2C-type Ser/Thr phosphatase [Conexibacter woesei]|uniref:Protein serine/threonine phosphatase n=1 Tax=Conexibacter woesei (strain DSM 14684 / CCUG 47730 / CIP 108061 / JCM 11494 / NBRC 100937 / ID131577) TaxID=469383 RepID=D3EYP6_CONWI|nr:Stp1/IreP family PP2C-type Ser/Thr phosphatase [Conexibacter woesei]ADB48450.1 protein serine/threonine phosphatase [Conexibacter woesei DSM 14684]